jgi:nicotinate-nucleotide adenylyltransferase
LQRILLYGGSFDPIHHGHLIVARFVAEHLAVSRVVLIPSTQPPHKPERSLSPAAERMEMCRRAVAGDPLFEVSAYEAERAGPNYTIDTVQHYRAQSGDTAELFWLVGMDSLRELHTWYRARELVELCTIVATSRPVYAPPSHSELERHFTPAQAARLLQFVVPGPRIEIAARDIRARVTAGRSIRYLVPEPIQEFIAQRGLYRMGRRSDGAT